MISEIPVQLFMTRAIDAVSLQPLASVAVTVYTLPDTGVTVTPWADAPVLQLYDDALPAVSVTGIPAQIVSLLAVTAIPLPIPGTTVS